MTDQPNEYITNMHETYCECREIANDLGLPITSAVNVAENEEPKQCSPETRAIMLDNTEGSSTLFRTIC